jgi:DNA-binding LacI/PurR family transcriptional regulator
VNNVGAETRPRIVDVALLAGVSRQTVSNVLNDRPGFTGDTRERVLRAVAETGYTRDQAARSLRTGRSRRIAFSMTPEDLDPRNPFSLTFLQAAVTVASELDRRLVVQLHPTEDDGSFRTDIGAREADGVVLTNSAPGDYRVAILEELSVPYALMGRTLPHQAQPWIDIDNAVAIGTAVDRVVGRGFRDVSYVGYGDNGEDWMYDRRRGVVERLAAYGISLPDQRNVQGSLSELGTKVRELLRSPEPPNAVITASDSIGVLVINVARELGLNIGTELVVTGFDGGILSTTVLPTLTTVGIPIATIADRLIRHLVEWIDSGKPQQLAEVFDTVLLDGGSA